MVSLTNIGTLFAFVLVCIGIPILRMKDPARPRPFRVPGGPWILPLLGAASCVFLMYYLPGGSWWRFIGWLVLGLAIYLSYGYTRSAIGQKLGRPANTPLPLKIAALGFLVLAVGLFAIPHDLGPTELLAAASDSAAERHGRALYGLILIVVGLVVGLAGSFVGSSRAADDEVGNG
jgi:APA family basic amino acid/polyamine antiporter